MSEKLNYFVLIIAHTRTTSPPYLPLGWSAHVQPEGQLYFACDVKPHIVTDAYMYSESIKEKVLHFVAIVCKTMEEKNVTVPDSAELYLNPSETKDSCEYYFVDHASHAVFWLEDVDVYEMDMWQVVSESHLGLFHLGETHDHPLTHYTGFVLMEHYWTHVEHFPSHRMSSLHLAIDELISIFIHGQGDQMTSTGSTFAYNAKQSKEHLRLLLNAKETLMYAPSVCFVARLWANTCKSAF